jgi:hypothetical protein
MDDVITRLRMTKLETEDMEDKNSKQLGRTWAMRTASYGQLNAAVHFKFVGEPMAPYRWIDLLYMAVQQWDEEEQGQPQTSEVEAWWCDEVGGRRAPSDATLLSFVEGAKEVWSEVAHRI